MTKNKNMNKNEIIRCLLDDAEHEEKMKILVAAGDFEYALRVVSGNLIHRCGRVGDGGPFAIAYACDMAAVEFLQGDRDGADQSCRLASGFDEGCESAANYLLHADVMLYVGRRLCLLGKYKNGADQFFKKAWDVCLQISTDDLEESVDALQRVACAYSDAGDREAAQICLNDASDRCMEIADLRDLVSEEEQQFALRKALAVQAQILDLYESK